MIKMLYKSSEQFVTCSVCGKLLVWNYEVVVPTFHAVVDSIETTPTNSKSVTWAAAKPAHYFCDDHVRESISYNKKGEKINVCY